MTDEQAFKNLMARFGIEPRWSAVEPHTYRLEADRPPVSGYTGFECVWTFDETGKFIGVGIWE